MPAFARVIVAAMFAFAVTPTILFGGGALFSRLEYRSLVGQRALLILGLVLPFAGFAFLVRPFGHWSDLDDSARRLCIILCAFYWTLYAPLLIVWLMSFGFGWNGMYP